ncbi:MAG: hypothetical protein NXY57DRAFT_251131 [Lentinula lateritia]|nr:MAG: hypothetical protein NXY57DRAFT_251131 [Lentinula lateritia]
MKIWRCTKRSRRRLLLRVVQIFTQFTGFNSAQSCVFSYRPQISCFTNLESYKKVVSMKRAGYHSSISIINASSTSSPPIPLPLSALCLLPHTTLYSCNKPIQSYPFLLFPITVHLIH